MAPRLPVFFPARGAPPLLAFELLACEGPALFLVLLRSLASRNAASRAAARTSGLSVRFLLIYT